MDAVNYDASGLLLAGRRDAFKQLAVALHDTQQNLYFGVSSFNDRLTFSQ